MRNIPSEYQEVEWIGEANAEDLFILPFYGSDDMLTIINPVMTTEKSSLYVTSRYIFGAHGSNDNYCCLQWNGTPSGTPVTNLTRLRLGSAPYHHQLITTYAYSNPYSRFILDFFNDSYLLTRRNSSSGLTYDGASLEVPSFETNDNLAIFGGSYLGTYPQNSTCSTFTRIIGRVLFHSQKRGELGLLVPVYRKSDGKVGYYDLTSGTFLISEYGATWSHGADV